ncbi:hypothetical protein N7541_000687 [Penicillium brevicompactum]|uniref:Uncharacterized protein n=1 Tax=Penicillium brevicompactum TaxID=5074 RepID=A0A9W9V596_PENBR|nr:hypothetical protein N7541_000687 [Penicillium brevicompactum]
MSDFILPDALVREIELALENSQIAQDALSEALPQEIQAKLMQAQKELFEDQSGQREEWVSFLVQNWRVLMHELQSIGNDRMVAYFAQDPPSEDINANQRLRYIAAANGLYVGLMEFRRVHWSTKEAVLAMNGMKMLCDTEDPTQKLWHDEAYCMFIEWAKATIQPVVTTQDQPMTGIAMEIPGGAQYASSIRPQAQQQLEVAATQDQRMTGSVMQIPGELSMPRARTRPSSKPDSPPLKTNELDRRCKFRRELNTTSARSFRPSSRLGLPTLKASL